MLLLHIFGTTEVVPCYKPKAWWFFRSLMSRTRFHWLDAGAETLASLRVDSFRSLYSRHEKIQ
jgi:hypothetical protein